MSCGPSLKVCSGNGVCRVLFPFLSQPQCDGAVFKVLSSHGAQDEQA